MKWLKNFWDWMNRDDPPERDFLAELIAEHPDIWEQVRKDIAKEAFQFEINSRF